MQQTEIETLKITYNNILGYFIEVPAKRADKLLVKSDSVSENPFVHRQTMSTAVRFTTPELAELERDISSAADKALALENQLFTELCDEVRNFADDICKQAKAIARIDVAAAVAELSIEQDYTRPAMSAGTEFEIIGGRHPVVEQALRRSAQSFIGNDCDLSDAHRLWLLTGPNMAGKSTFLRQNALIVILAQAGCYVPAASAKIGIVDKVFSRVGAADDLARGQSTFMIEMVETAIILNKATRKSLVILDEIGRGTSTFDGLSIAWACLEYLHNINEARALFATHYHELTTLREKLPHLSCQTMQVKEWQGDVIFLHAVAPGTADRSYGIHVAKLAGLPEAVTERSKQVLALLEQSERSGKLAKLSHDLPLFNALPATPKPSPLAERLDNVNPDSLSPKQALDLIYELKALSKD